jgi:hypothetical protein
MLALNSLKKQIKAIDLSLSACRLRQSPRTGFVHHFWGDGEFLDTIPLYENFCFATALYRQKTVESVSEGKELLEKLLAFQAPDGSFPIYLHEFPRCHDWMQGLKIAPFLIQLQRRFFTVLPPDLKKKIAIALEKIFHFSKDKCLGLWFFRYQMCTEGKGSFHPDPAQMSSSDWTQWLISAQLGDFVSFPSAQLFHPALQAFIGSPHADVQEKFEPRPTPLEWLLAEKEESFSKRLLQDHPLQMHLAALWPLQDEPQNHLSSLSHAIAWQADEPKGGNLFRILWGGSQLHSFVLPHTHTKSSIQDGKTFIFDLPEEADQTHNDLFEIVFYCSISPEISLTINEGKGTVFFLKDQIEIRSPKLTISLRFELLSGSGDFRGHLFYANRPSQTKAKNYEAYDWQIGLRTLRRSPKAQIRVSVDVVAYEL